MSAPDFATVNAAARAHLQSLLATWLPGGRRQGREWVARNPKRTDQHLGSFKTNLVSGTWSDFGTGEAGSDPVSLFAYLHDLRQGEAARRLAADLGIDDGNTPTVAGLASVAGGSGEKRNSEADDRWAGWHPIKPVPDDAPALTDAFMQQRGPQGFSLTVTYRYHSLSGDWLGTIARYDRKANGLPAAKEFRTFVFCEGANQHTWRCQGFSVPRPLYGLQQLGTRPDAPVLVCEGEKSADAAAMLFPDYVVVSSPNGAKSAGKADWSPLAGRAVVVRPDADQPGAQFAREVTEHVAKVGALARVVTLPPNLPLGWDLADALPAGLTALDFRDLLTRAREAQPDGPLPLFPLLPPAEPYPLAALGPVLADAAAAIARKIQVPPAMAGQSVLAAAALVAQAHADVRMPYGQTRPLSLFLVTVAASGDRKSSADNEALWPIAKHEKALREAHARAMTDWRIAQGAWAAEKKRIESDKLLSLDARRHKLQGLGDEPARPLAPFLVTGDLTIEGLTKNWAQALPALGIFTAEAGTFTGGHGMSDDARLRTAAMLSEVWDGKPVKRVRALDGITILPGRRLCMHLMIQPDAASGFLGNGTLRDQGLLSRVLVAAPVSLAGSRLHRDTQPADEAAIRSYGGRLLTLLETEPRLVPGTQNELDPPALTIEPEARDALIAFADHVERQCGSHDGLRPIADFAAKAAEHAARVAGVLAIIDSQRATGIGLCAMENALTLADWYVTETLRLHAAGHRDPKLVRAHALLTWLHERGDVEVEFRTVLQFGPGPLRTKGAAEEAIAILLAHGWLTEVSQRPKRFSVAWTGTDA